MITQHSELAEHPFLRGLTPAQIERLRACAREVEYPEGAFIFREGGAADALYLMRSGRVALEQHIPGRGVVQLESLGPGDLLGLSWLRPGGHWTLDARVVEPVAAFALGSECVRALTSEDPALCCTLSARVSQQLYQRLVRVRMQRLDLYGDW